LLRRDAAVAPSSCFRQVEGWRSAAQLESAWWQAPAAAWRQTVGSASEQVMASPSEMKAVVVAESVRQVASALQALLPAEEVAAESGAKVRPPEAAVAESAPSVRQLGAAEAEAESVPSVRRPGAAEEA
jgi:hypothetical protein